MAIEIVIFRLQEEVTRADFLAAVDETTALLKTQTGFLSRTVSQAESGEWIDILTWESIEAAKAAAAVFQTDAAGKRFSAYLDPQLIQVFYTEAVVEASASK
ncbi:hypothetical protein EPA93_05075 [Ktedonosporobacter rubrisoli]|uniref:ABM domain-containing protein n=1 Tax=Ktedonosporobacter rubrisoli TaxID=2509675 RepID=A0A4P6JJT3_KTERU|nr:hypothetical protein [Ktedonosporobacter rubrisoli]QBD75407.1 hypothetical protein EPA93_05075 [Ktedonosporobacter rubrisoli]